MSLTINQLRLLALSKRRFVTDAVAWLMLYALLALILPVLLWHQYVIDPGSGNLSIAGFIAFVLNQEYDTLNSIPVTAIGDIFNILVKDMIWFGLWLIPMVYINLLVLKKYILDYEPPRTWKYTLYLLSLLALSAAFAGLMIGTETYMANWVRTTLAFPLITIMNFGIALVSTGLIYREELAQQLNIMGGVEERLNRELEQVQQKLKETEAVFSKDHLKVGTKNHYKIIRFEEIIYVKANNNGSVIYTEKGKYPCSNRMMDYEDLLPKSDFIRTHNSYIIAKRKVSERDGDIFILTDSKGNVYKALISDSYRKKIDEDDYLRYS